jgi:hypothetical protein
MCFCTVDIREIERRFLRILTYIFPEEADKFTTIEGLLWQAARREIRGLLWQADPEQSSSKPPKKEFGPMALPSQSCGVLFVPSSLKGLFGGIAIMKGAKSWKLSWLR